MLYLQVYNVVRIQNVDAVNREKGFFIINLPSGV